MLAVSLSVAQYVFVAARTLSRSYGEPSKASFAISNPRPTWAECDRRARTRATVRRRGSGPHSQPSPAIPVRATFAANRRDRRRAPFQQTSTVRSTIRSRTSLARVHPLLLRDSSHALPPRWPSLLRILPHVIASSRDATRMARRHEIVRSLDERTAAEKLWRKRCHSMISSRCRFFLAISINLESRDVITGMSENRSEAALPSLHPLLPSFCSQFLPYYDVDVGAA